MLLERELLRHNAMVTISIPVTSLPLLCKKTKHQAFNEHIPTPPPHPTPDAYSQVNIKEKRDGTCRCFFSFCFVVGQSA